MRLDALPPHLRQQAERQLGLVPSFPLATPRVTSRTGGGPLASSASARPLRRRKAGSPSPTPPPDPTELTETDYAPGTVTQPPARDAHGEPNRTEAEFNARYLGGKGRYEALSFRLPGGSVYTPDWFYLDDGVPTFVECKGSFRFASHSRSATAFRETVARFPFWNFVWATKQKGGTWTLKRIERTVVP